MNALVSIHDVMPSTMEFVAHWVDRCLSYGLGPITLLVVPGVGWSEPQLAQLHTWIGQGCELAAHGWRHECEEISSWSHWLHSRILSRNVAEHLSLNEQGIVQLMCNSHAWFEQHAFAGPSLYVPPAWALGKLSRGALCGVPFAMIETLTGVYLSQRRGWCRLPLVGFEADNCTRSCSLRFLNSLSIHGAGWADSPLRIAIHPYDLQLRLSHQIDPILGSARRFLSYTQLTSASTAQRTNPAVY